MDRGIVMVLHDEEGELSRAYFAPQDAINRLAVRDNVQLDAADHPQEEAE